MEIASSIWLIGIISLAAGALIGALAYRRLAPSVRQADQVKTDLDATRDELQNYKKSVDEHFDKTAELVNDLTQNYVKVYQHLAAGAQALGDGKRFDNLLEQQPGKVAIAVDDEARGADPIEAEATRDEPAASIADAPTGSGDEQPPVEAGAEAGRAPGAAFEARAETATATGNGDEAAVSADDSEIRPTPESGAAARDPVLNVDALDEAIEKADREGDSRKAATVPESKPEPEVRTTTH